MAKKSLNEVSAEMYTALKVLSARFALDGFTAQIANGSRRKDNCNCNQFVDQGDCRHLMALRAERSYQNWAKERIK